MYFLIRVYSLFPMKNEKSLSFSEGASGNCWISPEIFSHRTKKSDNKMLKKIS